MMPLDTDIQIVLVSLQKRIQENKTSIEQFELARLTLRTHTDKYIRDCSSWFYVGRFLLQLMSMTEERIPIVGT